MQRTKSAKARSGGRSCNFMSDKYTQIINLEEREGEGWRWYFCKSILANHAGLKIKAEKYFFFFFKKKKLATKNMGFGMGID